MGITGGFWTNISRWYLGHWVDAKRMTCDVEYYDKLCFWIDEQSNESDRTWHSSVGIDTNWSEHSTFREPREMVLWLELVRQRERSVPLFAIDMEKLNCTVHIIDFESSFRSLSGARKLEKVFSRIHALLHSSSWIRVTSAEGIHKVH